MIFLDGPSNSSDDEIIIEELNVEIGKGLQEEARGLEVTREELSDASKVDEKWKRNSKEKLMDESTEMGPSFAPPQIQVHDHLQTSGRVGVSGELQRFEEMIQCNCGHKGPIASHLRTNQQCVQSIRDELSLGVEISDESLIIQTTLVLRGCPAVGCAGGNHDEIPMVCMSWWQESGWNVMQWEETGEDLTSTVIKQKCKQFVMDLMQQNDDGQQETAPDNKNAADRIQTDGNMEEKSMTELDNVFLPPITSTQKDTTNARREGGKRPAANVSKKLGFLIEPGSMWTLVHVGPE